MAGAAAVESHPCQIHQRATPLSSCCLLGSSSRSRSGLYSFRLLGFRRTDLRGEEDLDGDVALHEAPRLDPRHRPQTHLSAPPPAPLTSPPVRRRGPRLSAADCINPLKIPLFLSLDCIFLKLAPEGLGTRCIQGRKLCPSSACNNALRNENIHSDRDSVGRSR